MFVLNNVRCFVLSSSPTVVARSSANTESDNNHSGIAIYFWINNDNKLLNNINLIF